MGCETQSAEGRRKSQPAHASGKRRKLSSDNGLQPARRLSAALPTLPTSEPGSVTRRVLGVPQRGRPRRAGRDRNEREGSDHDEQNEDHHGGRARLRACGRTRGRAVGQRGTGPRTAGSTERTQDVDCAPALQRLGRQADARRARRADGRGRTARGARAARRCRSEARACSGADGADVRAGVPRRLRRTLEARDTAGACGRNEPLHTARVRRSPRRCGYREGRAQLVRRSLGHAGSVGEPGAGGAVVDDEARGGTRAAARGLQPVQGTAPAQDGLRGALPDGRRVRRARSGARRSGSGSSGRRRRGALPALHRRAQVRGAAAQVGARSRRPRGAAGFQDWSPHDLARVSSPCRARGAATAHQLPVGLYIALRRACDGGQ